MRVQSHCSRKRAPLLAVLPAVLTMLALGGCDMFASADQRVDKAERMIAAHDYRAAAIELKNAVESEPGNARARLKLAEVSLLLGDVASADKELQRAFEAGAKPADAAMLAAEVRLASGRFQELLTQLDTGELPLMGSQAAELRGRALLGLRNWDAAATAFREALKIEPNRIESRVGLAEAQAAQGAFDIALADLDALVASVPDAATAWLVRGTLLAQRGQFEQARQSLERAHEHAQDKLTPREQTILLATLTEAQLAVGNVEAAGRTHAELAQLAPGSPLTHLLKARIAMASRNYQAATAELQPIVSASPEFVPARFLLGAALLAQGNLQQAEQHLARVLQQAPDNLEARKLLAQVRLRLGRPDEAMQVLMPSGEADESDSQLDALIGAAYMQQGQTEEALVHLERTVAQRPNDRNPKLDLATAYLRFGRHDKALEILQRVPRLAGDARRETLTIAALAAVRGIAAARDQVEKWVGEAPKDVALLNFAAAFLARQGEIERARNLLGKAAAAEPNNTTTLVNWARVEAAAGNQGAASEKLTKALAIDPQNQTAQFGLAQLAIKRGDLPDAIERLEALRKRDATAITARLELAKVYLGQGEAAKTQDLVRETLAAAPDRADVRNAIGLLYLDANRYEEALAQFRDAATRDSHNALYWMNTARAQLALGNRGAARESLQRAVGEQPDWVPAAGALVMLDLQEKKRDAAVARVAELRKRRPDDPAGMGLEGDLHSALGQYERADQAYRAAAKVRPAAALAIKSYRVRYLGKLNDAVEPLEAWLEHQPEDFQVRVLLAEAYSRAGQRPRAIEQYELIVANQGGNVFALNNLAWLYHETGDARALDTARRAYEKARTSVAVADTYGWILVQTGKIAEGLVVLRSAAGGSDVDPEIQYHLAFALARSGERAEARERLTRLLSQRSEFASRGAAEKMLAELAGAAPPNGAP